jgi:hypothetical protein
MTKREIKRLACFLCSRVLKNALDNGWEVGAVVSDEVYGKKIRDAVAEVVEELASRGRGRR